MDMKMNEQMNVLKNSNNSNTDTSVQNSVNSLLISGWTYWWKRSSTENVLPLTF